MCSISSIFCREFNYVVNFTWEHQPWSPGLCAFTMMVIYCFYSRFYEHISQLNQKQQPWFHLVWVCESYSSHCTAANKISCMEKWLHILRKLYGGEIKWGMCSYFPFFKCDWVSIDVKDSYTSPILFLPHTISWQCVATFVKGFIY